MFRVPLLLEQSLAVIYRLSAAATDILQPMPGVDSGYDDDFREPVLFDDAQVDGTERVSARQELPPIRIPCQVEPMTYQKLAQFPPGNMPDSNLVLVMHRRDLLRLNLIDKKTRDLALNINDRVDHLEAKKKPGVTTHHIKPPGYFIYEIRPGSEGFGPDGYDLHIVYMSERERVNR